MRSSISILEVKNMAQHQYIKELLTTATGTEGTLLIPRKIYDTIIDEAAKKLIPRTEAAYYFGPGDIPGSSLDLNLLTENSLDVRIVSEGAEVPLDQAEYSNTNLKPKKYGVAIRITTELLEDAKWNLLQHNVMLAGRRFAENENSLTVVALDGAANTVTGGAAITIPNITRAMQFLNDADKNPTSFAVGMEVLNDLRNIDTFVDYQKIGNTDMLTKGYLGNVYGMGVIPVSSNAGMTATSSYVFDRDHAYAIAEKRALTVQNFDLPTYDMSGAVITHRISVTLIRSNAVAKITTT